MLIRPQTSKDLIFLNTWGYSFANSKYSYVALNPLGLPVLYGCLFPLTDGPAFIESFIASPFIGKEERRALVRAMLEYLIERAKEYGCRGVISTTAIPSVKDTFYKLGFIESETGLSALYRSL